MAADFDASRLRFACPARVPRPQQGLPGRQETPLPGARMALEAIQAQAGHRSIETTRIHLHLSNEWLADEYARAARLLDATTLEAVTR